MKVVRRAVVIANETSARIPPDLEAPVTDVSE
jgi:hypothetical protein